MLSRSDIACVYKQVGPCSKSKCAVCSAGNLAPYNTKKESESDTTESPANASSIFEVAAA